MKRFTILPFIIASLSFTNQQQREPLVSEQRIFHKWASNARNPLRDRPKIGCNHHSRPSTLYITLIATPQIVPFIWLRIDDQKKQIKVGHVDQKCCFSNRTYLEQTGPQSNPSYPRILRRSSINLIARALKKEAH